MNGSTSVLDDLSGDPEPLCRNLPPHSRLTPALPAVLPLPERPSMAMLSLDQEISQGALCDSLCLPPPALREGPATTRRRKALRLEPAWLSSSDNPPLRSDLTRRMSVCDAALVLPLSECSDDRCECEEAAWTRASFCAARASTARSLLTFCRRTLERRWRCPLRKHGWWNAPACAPFRLLNWYRLSWRWNDVNLESGSRAAGIRWNRTYRHTVQTWAEIRGGFRLARRDMYRALYCNALTQLYKFDGTKPERPRTKHGKCIIVRQREGDRNKSTSPALTRDGFVSALLWKIADEPAEWEPTNQGSVEIGPDATCTH